MTAEAEATPVADGPSPLRPRAYQQEMLAESLRQNTIIAMETGSGKTQIAILRIQEELARCAADKLIWFLAPTVALAEQQHSVISKQLPLYQSRLLLGSDNVDHWSTQEIWNKILLNIRIVVSTPQVLLDAMCHGFVKLSGLSLLVFDEAHRCVGASPFNGIMRLYHHARLLNEESALPAILGLTATPATKATAAAVKILEENLHAICRTPVVQREELLKFAHKPELDIITYKRNFEAPTKTLENLSALLDLTLKDIDNDPYIKSLRARKDAKSQEALHKTLKSGKTFTRKELISLSQRALVIHAELGPWAADVFVNTCADRFVQEAVQRANNNVFRQWEDTEKIYMMQYLSMLPPTVAQRSWGSEPDSISEKAQLLINAISKSFNPGYRIIVFAEQRATVIMLAHILSVHPLMKGIVTKYFLGNSNYASRKSNITELSSLKDQKDVLTDLRTGKANVLIATSVLEEGIDVPACNIVVCFDPPTDLRSFVQRRGRARDRQSKLVLFINSSDDDSLAKWGSMEEQLKEIYADNMRELEEIKALEDLEEESTDFFRIPETEAVLSHENARQYLAFFCSTMSCAFTDNQPDYIVHRKELSREMAEVTAKVVLPSLLDPSLRTASSQYTWRTEKAAKRDAAYQAYLALYNAGLVDDHLMPCHRRKYLNPDKSVQEKQVKLGQVSGCWTPWQDMAQLRRSNVDLIPTRVYLEPNPLGMPDMILLLPSRIPCDWSFDLFWNQDITLRVRLCNEGSTTLSVDSDQASRFTREVLVTAYEGRMTTQDRDLLTLFWPAETITQPTEDWLDSITGKYEASTLQDDQYAKERLEELGMARTTDRNARPFFIEQNLEMAAMAVDDVAMQGEETVVEPIPEPHLKGTTLPKRADFLHTILQQDQVPLAHTAQQCFPVRLCRVDRLPARFAKFALFIPSITHKIEILFVAERLAKTVLASVQFQNLGHVLTAISASVAKEATDYQRYEFLGDSLLKLLTSIHLVANNPLWHEGLLSAEKDRFVSNERLARTARELGLDRFILTKSFTGRKWRPKYISQFNDEEGESKAEKRELSSKTLADVVESLMGAAFLDGGYEKLERCVKIFLPENPWSGINTDVHALYTEAVVSEQAASHVKLPQMEEILGYKFTKPSILFEALTHPCSNDGSPSYQRLEFLGDSLLDHFVVQELFHQPTQLSHQDMHLMRTAVVNAHFLGFLCQSLYITESRSEAAEPGQAHISTIETEHKVYLWQMMRHGASWEIMTAQQEVQARYEKWGAEVHDALNQSPRYPWAALFRINASKFFSDIVESILGAIFVDSQGSLDTCRTFLERLGVLPCLQRIIHERVEILHPFSQVREAAKSEKVDIRSCAEERVVSSSSSDNDDTSSASSSSSSTSNSTGAQEKSLVYICTVTVGTEEIVQLSDGVNKLEVETRAAALAADILKARMNVSVSP